MRLIIIFILLIISNSIFAQGILSGKITEKNTGNPLAGANIKLSETLISTSTDNAGEFKITSIKSGEYTVQITYVGYLAVIKKIQISDNKKTELEIELEITSHELKQIVVTATRTERNLEDVPARVIVIKKEDIEIFPTNNIDDLFRMQPNMNPDRTLGMFAKNSSVSMRGLTGSYRVLTLIDGTPLNKTDGGGVNWNRINGDNIDHIEIIKGPGSSLYGGNAMGGVINIITRKPEKQVEGMVRVLYGMYNTTGTSFYTQGTFVKEDKGFYWGVNGFLRKSDGIYVVPDSTRDTTDKKTYLTEYSAGAKAGYQFNKYNSLEFDYSYYDNKTGDGIQVYDPDGGFNTYTTNYVKFRYRGGNENTKIEINTFAQFEDYLTQKESAKFDVIPPYALTKYSIYKTESNRDDKGIWGTVSHKFFSTHNITAGADYKKGSVNAHDVYFTSTDTIINKGAIDFYALFTQDEFNLFNNNLKIIAGLRMDWAYFNHGNYELKSASSANIFLIPYSGNFRDTLWHALSPKLNVQYKWSNNIRTYFAYGRGFRPPILDDMCRFGNISKGFKYANPNLKPEVIDNFELGADLKPNKKIVIETSVYYMLGNDFMYFVGTGDSVWAGTKMKPVLKRENISKVEVIGTEFNFTYNISDSLSFNANYAYNHSVIKEFDTTKYITKDLKGKYLMELPPHKISGSILWRNKYVNTMFACNYSAAQWVDDENITKEDPYYTFDIKFSRIFKDKYLAALGIKNITNKQYLDNKGNISLGRFITVEAGIKF